ncbi:cysteine desulfurase family protein [Sphingosinicella rhizophila]|uniref:Cysteine desulfurase n=1 Tax=Sphingosinicella rhizophila TaxID=3050082 RepID=A0ABU3Q2D1_9SPHN|nr:cysteine desulfurase family protein [Sphingosinicella sp. GR2756]MDT9597539.1 cysteine desulfurase family protein [Sphingosinicella sp. GR2756]
MTKPIYLDYQATTPLAPEVADAMRPWLEENFGNPHSTHRMGREAAAAVDVARGHVLAAIGGAAGSGKIYFTSGATEAANWALKGAAARFPSGRNRIVTIATEHACVLDSLAWLREQGMEIEILPVGADGIVDLDLLERQVTDRTGLVAAMLVNNEIGVIQPIAEIGRLARSRGALFFCDAVQGLGRVALPLEECDMVAMSAHKIYGPKGIGALWLRSGVAIEPLLHGGGQEGGIRSGTLSPLLCVGFGAAARLMAERKEEDAAHIEPLWNAAESLVTSGWVLNGSSEHRYRGNLNMRRSGLDVARLISDLRMVALSAGSACASGSGRPSHVLSALGLSEKDARSSVRIGFGRYTTVEEMNLALTMIEEAAERQRRFAA